MADGNFGERVIDIDLTVTGARVLRDPLDLGKVVKISTVVVDGNPGAGGTAIVLRKESSSGPIIYSFTPTASVPNHSDDTFEEDEIVCKGLYLDNLTGAWTSGHLLIYTR